MNLGQLLEELQSLVNLNISPETKIVICENNRLVEMNQDDMEYLNGDYYADPAPKMCARPLTEGNFILLGEPGEMKLNHFCREYCDLVTGDMFEIEGVEDND